MKVVACEKCGAKYQIGDNEKVDDYECSVCAGNLKSIDEYPSKHSLRNQGSIYKDDSDSKIVCCTECGLKYTLKSNENPKDYECSSCYGNLRYIDEKLNENLDETEESEIPENEIPENKIAENKIAENRDFEYSEDSKDFKDSKDSEDSEDFKNSEDVIYVEKPFYGSNILKNSNISSKSKNILEPNKEPYNQTLDDKSNYNNIPKFDSDIIYPVTETNIRKLEKKLRKKIKNDFEENIAINYRRIIERKIDNEDEKDLEKNKTLKSEESIYDKISKRNKEETSQLNILKTNQNEKNEENNGNGEFEVYKQKQELVPHPNEKNTSYHDVYIIAGLVIALIGLLDVLLSQRTYSVIFIAIGIVIFIIGLIKNNNYVSTEKRGKLIREKLLTLPDNFYVLYYVRVPNSNEGINHVVVGSSGIFSIVSQSYNEKEDKEKTKTENENENENLVNKPDLDDLTLLDETENIDVTNNKNMKNNIITNSNTSNNNGNTNNSDSNNRNNNSNTNNNRNNNSNTRNNEKIPRKFKFKEAENKFSHNNKIKQKSIRLSEQLIDFLNESGFQNFYVEPLVGFVNNEVAVINMPLTDEDLFIDELLQKIVHGKRQLDDKTTHRVAVLLSQYATECSS